jgi:hypothetical protein
MRKQHQEGGDGAELNQAGRDIIKVEGISTERALEIAEKVVARELGHYGQRARLEVDARLSEFRSDLFERILRIDRNYLSAFEEPDIQGALIDAQLGYARSGATHLKPALVDLIIARCAARNGSLQATLTNEAIRIVPQLTGREIVALTIMFLVRSAVMSNRGESELGFAESINHLETSFEMFGNGLSVSKNECQHLAYLRCTSIERLGPQSFEGLMRYYYPGLFSKGEKRERLIELMDGSADNFDTWAIPALHDPDNYQIDLLGPADLAEFMSDHEIPQDKEQVVHELLLHNSMSDEEFATSLVNLNPKFRAWIGDWNSNSLLRLSDPTILGQTIAHCYWTNTAQVDAPLSVWVE